MKATFTFAIPLFLSLATVSARVNHVSQQDVPKQRQVMCLQGATLAVLTTEQLNQQERIVSVSFPSLGNYTLDTNRLQLNSNGRSPDGQFETFTLSIDGFAPQTHCFARVDTQPARNLASISFAEGVKAAANQAVQRPSPLLTIAR